MERNGTNLLLFLSFPVTSSQARLVIPSYRAQTYDRKHCHTILHRQILVPLMHYRYANPGITSA